jgi:putative ATP-dependent endonuclease of OLD family
MRISRLRVENFRNFRLLEIDPFPTNAVIVGENGVGKSNLLHALRLVLDPDLSESGRRLKAEDICDYAGATLADGIEVRIEVEVTDIEGDPASETAFDGCFVSLTPLTARLTYVYRPLVDPSQSDRKLTRDDYDYSITGGLNGDKDARRIRRDVSLTVLPALRDAADMLSRWRGSPLQELLEAHPPERSALEAAAHGIQDAMDVLAKDKQVTAIANDLSNRLTDMAGPQMDIEPTLGFASSLPDRLLRSIRLYVDADRARSVAETSTGNANVIYLGLLLERLAARRATDVVVDTVLAVEEPEAHLHPVLQRQLFRYLLRSQTALVVTTHSPHIAAVTQLDALVLLRPDDTKATVAATAVRAGLTPAQQTDLERYLDVSRAELLFCTAAILVEGISEVYLLPALARVLDFDLDSHGVVIANISGTDFAPYRGLLARDALNVPHVIVTDGDPVRKGAYVLGGLRRAARLMPDGAARSDLDDSIGLAVGNDTIDVTSERQKAARMGLFVGVNTLEVDIAPLLVSQMIDAHTELSRSSNLRAKFDAAARAVSRGDSGAGQRTELLRRIDQVSKGRFAQRLADHVERDETEIRTAITNTAADSEPYELDGDTWPEPVADASHYVDCDELIAMGSYGYLLAALDHISWRVRGQGIVRRVQQPGSADKARQA